MLYDYNMMIEEYGFYNQLPYRYQKELVDLLFEEFIESFEAFFKFQECGFKNDFIVNMLCRMP